MHIYSWSSVMWFTGACTAYEITMKNIMGCMGHARLLVVVKHINTRLLHWDEDSPLGRRRSVAPVHPQTPGRFRSSLHRCSSRTEPMSSGSVRLGCLTFTGPCAAASGLIQGTSDLHQPNLIRTSAVLRMRLSLSLSLSLSLFLIKSTIEI